MLFRFSPVACFRGRPEFHVCLSERSTFDLNVRSGKTPGHAQSNHLYRWDCRHRRNVAGPREQTSPPILHSIVTHEQKKTSMVTDKGRV